MIDETFLSQTSKVITTVTTIEETFLRQTSKVITTSNNDRRNIPQSNLKSYNNK
jgi:hypothetical protein